MLTLPPQTPPPHTLDYRSPEPPRLPASLVAVAWLFIAFGILSAIQMVISLTQSTCSFQFGVLGIFVGRGLLKLRPGWRTCGLVGLWFNMIVGPLLFCLIAGNHSGTITMNGRVVNSSGTNQLIIIGGAVWGLASWIASIWAYRVLIRSDLRQLFGLQ